MSARAQEKRIVERNLILSALRTSRSLSALSARVVDSELASKRREKGATKVVPFFVLLKNLHHQVSLGGGS
jgi:hypothetical protein